MSSLGINCTSEQVCLVRTTGTGDEFKIIDPKQVAIDGKNWMQLYQTLTTYISAARKGPNRIDSIGICKKIAGKYSAKPEAFKAEAIVELIAQQLSVPTKSFTPHALKAALGCSKNEAWQDKSKAIFNADKGIPNFGDGLDGAAAAAFGAFQDE